MAWIIKNITEGPVSINDIKVIIMPNEEIDIEKDINMMKAIINQHTSINYSEAAFCRKLKRRSNYYVTRKFYN